MTSPSADSAQALRVLLVEDSPEDAELLLWQLRQGGFAPVLHRIDTEAQMALALARERWDIVIADHAMPSFSSAAALALLRRSDDDTPFIIVSGRIDEADAVDAMKAGAQDYIWKDHLTRLAPAVRRELLEARRRRERRHTRDLLQKSAVQYRHILELCPDAILVASGSTVAFANQAAARLLGANIPDQLVGGRLEDLAAPGSRLTVARLIDSPRQGSERRTAMAQWVRADGTTVETDVASSGFVLGEALAVQLVIRPASGASLLPLQLHAGAATEIRPDRRDRRGYRPGGYAATIGILVFAALFGLT